MEMIEPSVRDMIVSRVRSVLIVSGGSFVDAPLGEQPGDSIAAFEPFLCFSDWHNIASERSCFAMFSL